MKLDIQSMERVGKQWIDYNNINTRTLLSCIVTLLYITQPEGKQ